RGVTLGRRGGEVAGRIALVGDEDMRRDQPVFHKGPEGPHTRQAGQRLVVKAWEGVQASKAVPAGEVAIERLPGGQVIGERDLADLYPRLGAAQLVAVVLAVFQRTQ